MKITKQDMTVHELILTKSLQLIDFQMEILDGMVYSYSKQYHSPADIISRIVVQAIADDEWSL